MTTREAAMQWWNNLPLLDNTQGNSRNNLAMIYYSRPWSSLTGREIEYIWQQEQIN